MAFTQSTHRRLRLLFSARTVVTAAAGEYGYILGTRAPRQLADALSVGLTVMAVAFAVAFALSTDMRPSKALKEMLHADREMVRLGVYVLKRAAVTTVLILAYVGLAGSFPQYERPVAILGAASAMSLGWVLCSLPSVFRRRAEIIAGAEDEHPGFGGLWQSLRLFRNTTSTELRLSASGWFVPGHPGEAPEDSPPFVAKELARRYGAFRSMAFQQYTQICDMAGQAEAAERIARIESCLKEMDRLCDLEQRMRKILTKDPKLLKNISPETLGGA